MVEVLSEEASQTRSSSFAGDAMIDILSSVLCLFKCPNYFSLFLFLPLEGLFTVQVVTRVLIRWTSWLIDIMAGQRNIRDSEHAGHSAVSCVLHCLVLCTVLPL